jgi:CcmD family protein
MHKKIYKLVLALLCWFLFAVPAWAQEKAGDTVGLVNKPGVSDPVQMADKFRADGKIYVVIAVLVTILLGIFIYLIRLDRKINHLEKDFNK